MFRRVTGRDEFPVLAPPPQERSAARPRPSGSYSPDKKNPNGSTNPGERFPLGYCKGSARGDASELAEAARAPPLTPPRKDGEGK